MSAEKPGNPGTQRCSLLAPVRVTSHDLIHEVGLSAGR
jgi:hypothetical protein